MAVEPAIPRRSVSEIQQQRVKAEGPTLKDSTLAHYENALRAYVAPVFGKRSISEITRESV